MNKKDIVRSALSHQECGRIPYCIHLTGPANNKFGSGLLKRYAAAGISEDLSKGRITKSEAVSLAVGNHMFCLTPPWWSWYNMPDCYSDYDAPDVLPKISGYGSYEKFFNKIKRIKDKYDCYILIMIYGSHFEKANFARGIENFLGDLAGNIRFAQRMLDFIIEMNMVMLRNIVSIPEIDGILLGSDWGTQLSMLMSPITWKEVIAPGEQKEYDLIMENGKDIWIHSCGNIRMIIPELITMGVNALNPIQPECMDIYSLKDIFGDRLAFWGGISTQRTLPYGTPEQVKDDVFKTIKYMGKKGGYITAPSQEIQTDVPFENLIALIESARDFA